MSQGIELIQEMLLVWCIPFDFLFKGVTGRTADNVINMKKEPLAVDLDVHGMYAANLCKSSSYIACHS